MASIAGTCGASSGKRPRVGHGRAPTVPRDPPTRLPGPQEDFALMSLLVGHIRDIGNFFLKL